ncbi:hypothetical protein JX265_000050 [Neoarthrinium moseri]|uniref:lytic cellulose monooxygenase (C4-dehydrogenating) n=1 Tax=Neoarthrinium moseri TaxID=1658444 RepID=A0A9P9WXT0_9PEZI|nr:hypothetical protein JX265_000050 [Neoarthrinium moseri]
MKYSVSALVGLSAALANAHTAFTTLHINDVSQGDGTCVRMNMRPENATSPIPSLSSNDMACGSTGETAVAFTCPAPAGAKLTFEWRVWPNREEPGAIDPGHKGPCAVYAKQVDDMASTPAAGPGWFKIWEEGYDDSAGKWCTEKLIAADGLMSVEIPPGLPSGNWLFRPELLALHNADKGDPQFYTGCAQVQVQGGNSGTLDVPAEYSVSIPGYVKYGDASVSFNIYPPVFPYPMPGPDVYTVPSSGASASSLSDTSSMKALGGATLIPSDCLIKEGNWCGVEIADYSNEDGCWNASEECYNQAETCYASVGPTGNRNCKVWEAKCKGIQDACNAKNFQGPPNKGQKLQDAEAMNLTLPAVNNLGVGLGSANTNSGSQASTETSGASMATSTSAATSSQATSSGSQTGETTAQKATVSAGKSTSSCNKKMRRRRRGGVRK